MSQTPPHVVFDAVVFVQALISDKGPAAVCIERIKQGNAILFVSDAVLAEITNVPLRPELTRRYSQLTPERVDAFVREVMRLARVIPTPPRVFSLPRDPKDEPYTDLAVAAGAEFLVTWNERHLTYLMRQDTPEGHEFCRRFPYLKILSPPAFLQEMDRIKRNP